MSPPYPWPENITSIIDLISYANTVTGGKMGLGILVVVGVVAFLTTKAYTYERAFAFSAFLVFIISIFMRFMNLISDTIMFTCVALLVGAVIFLFFEREKENV